MAYVPIPKDLTKVRQKLILNLTKRQVICFSGGALIGVPLFFLTKNALPGSMATFLMIFAMMPFFAFGMYEKNGEPLEVVLRHIIESRYLRRDAESIRPRTFMRCWKSRRGLKTR